MTKDGFDFRCWGASQLRPVFEGHRPMMISYFRPRPWRSVSRTIREGFSLCPPLSSPMSSQAISTAVEAIPDGASHRQLRRFGG